MNDVPREGQTPLDRLKAIEAAIGQEPKTALVAAKEFAFAHHEWPAAWRLLALAMRGTGDKAGADVADLKAVDVGALQPRLAAAGRAFADDRLQEAESLVRAYLREEDAKDAGGALLLARIALRCGAIREAENLSRRAVLLAPGFDAARMVLARAEYDARNIDGALATLAELLDRVPDHLDALSLKAAIHVQLRQMADADATFLTLHASYPDDSRSWMNHAFMLKTIGRREDAVVAYRRAIAVNGANGQAWWGLANLKLGQFDEADIAIMQAMLARNDISKEERLHLLFALGKALETRQRYDEAFASFAAGARLRLEGAPHDPARVWEDVSRTANVFTEEFYSKRQGWGCASAEPIFIVSLPRSGSTLVEQILASHSAIEGTEELFDLERIALEMGSGEPGGYLDRIGKLSRQEVRALGETYLRSTARFRETKKPHFTDKMPSNWMYTGLIRLILPNARIIDIRRHPLSCGMANFAQHFNWGINFSYDLDHIGQFYAAYVKQMAQFDRTVPDHIHHLTHEHLVDNLEGEVRRMLDYLGLPFEEACLRFHETKRAVHTPSSEQVRRPINRDGLERWRHYEQWLDPLKKALGKVLDYYPLSPPD